MRIALVAPLVAAIAEPYIGGAQALLADLAQGLALRKHEVTLFARHGSAVPGVNIESIAVPESIQPTQFSSQERLPDPSFFAHAHLFLNLFLQLRQRQEEFDLVHVHAFDWPAVTYSVILHNTPVVYTIHLPAVLDEINDALRVLNQQGHPLRLLTVSQACASTYKAFTPFDDIIYNGLDLSLIPSSFQVADTAPLLFAGRITPEKGVEAAIEIAVRAGQKLLIAGGIYDQHYYKHSIEPRLQDAAAHVTYLGQLDRPTLWNIMGTCRGLLFPCMWDEPFGLTAVEAMATGTPVIGFRRGALPEVIRHGETGFLVDAGDCEGAAAFVSRLHDLSRQRCRAHVETYFSLIAMLDAHERIYSSLLA